MKAKIRAALFTSAALVFCTLTAGAWSSSARADLPGAVVNGSLEFPGHTGNYFDPALGYVPAGYGNAAGSTVVLSGVGGGSFAFLQGGGTIEDPGIDSWLAEFNGSQLTVTFRNQNYPEGTISGSVLTFQSSAFIGLGLLPVGSDDFLKSGNGGMSATLVGDTITLSVALQCGPCTWPPTTYTNTYSFVPPIKVTVDGKASVYQVFGHPGTYDSTSLDAARVDFPAGSNEFQFSVVGGISCCAWLGVGTPDWQLDETHPDWPGPANTAPYNGMSGTAGDVWLGLMGVFTSESDPYGGEPPESLPYDGSNPTSLSPSLNQVFYIGDGRAGRDNPSGELLTFTPPPSASRLYLGFYDGYGGAPAAYHDNSGSMTVTVHRISMDTTPPLIEANFLGNLANNGWYVSDVQVAWTVTDPESAIAETTGCEPASVTSDTTGATFTCSATSLGGTTTESVTIKRDTMPPIAIATAGPPPNAAGWNRTNVTVTFTGTDATSGVESCDPPVILKTNGTDQSASGRCYDFAGNQSDLATASGINIDKTKPMVVVTSPTPGAVYSVGQVVLASFSCDDALSGIVSCIGTVANGQPINTSKVSPVRSFKVTGKDAAGNSTSVTVKYAVQ